MAEVDENPGKKENVPLVKKILIIAVKGLFFICLTRSGKYLGFLVNPLKISLNQLALFITSLVLSLNIIALQKVFFIWRVFSLQSLGIVLLVYLAAYIYFKRNVKSLMKFMAFFYQNKEVKQLVESFWKIDVLLCLILFLLLD
ncbi:hypothetical protein [Flavilitoribacter nigricans]|uniref:Uncharacterized protein n=1 Tax=Flavilitoribacter nigricans (strain ATCC 23147 / DSM 23189 / NBRC 102662 / NCIMB 1420 / SS-2) TaxID=1122177 RepID=A0A2D0N6R5_FLAN2|nr:hypothetical protein [Flavilitoribacter nigricans]PHN04211.1 hypothetical protein CRP01_21855 [Flavilitoribacter nigricans DSM 23189 = NBRC 102662]